LYYSYRWHWPRWNRLHHFDVERGIWTSFWEKIVSILLQLISGSRIRNPRE
jgi:hypothetical protein